MPEVGFMEDVRQLDRITYDRRFFLHVMLRGLVLSSVWAVLAALIQPGTLLAVVQVVLFLLSLVLVAYPAYLFFHARTSTVLAFLAGCGLWLLWTLLFRSFLLTMLGTI